MSARHRHHKRKICEAEQELKHRRDLLDAYAVVLMDLESSSAAVVADLAAKMKAHREEFDRLWQIIADLERSMPK